MAGATIAATTGVPTIMAVEAMIVSLPKPPLLNDHKPFAGRIRQDFRAVFKSEDAAMKLALIEPHLGRELTGAEINAAIPAIEQATPRWGSEIGPFHMAAIIRDKPHCQQLAQAICAAFRFRDKTTPRWVTVYALASVIDDTPAIEVGITEIDFRDLIDRLRAPSPTGRDTRLRRFQSRASEAGKSCYVWPLECYPGDLDQAQAVTNRWRQSALSTGLAVPEQTTAIGFRDEQTTLIRRWPPYIEMVEHGVEIAAIVS